MNRSHPHRNSYYTLSGVEFEGEDRANFGKGPKGYKRPDDAIKEEASTILYAHHEIDASDIELTVEDGYIFLKGSVKNRDMKRMTQNCLEGISGVEDVLNQLTIKSTEPAKDMKSEISRNLSRDEELRRQKMG